jgi:hypothetical protein
MLVELFSSADAARVLSRTVSGQFTLLEVVSDAALNQLKEIRIARIQLYRQ